MPDLLYTTNYRLRKPQSADLRSSEDFRRVFNDNPEIVDRELKALNDALSALTGLASLSGEDDGTGNAARLLQLLNRLYLLESSAFAGFRKDGGGWYACNKFGKDVDGPFDFGSGNAVTTLSEYLNAVEDDTVVYEDPTPVSGAALGPDRTLAGLLNAVPDDTVIYEEPTPISA